MANRVRNIAATTKVNFLRFSFCAFDSFTSSLGKSSTTLSLGLRFFVFLEVFFFVLCRRHNIWPKRFYEGLLYRF